MNQWIEMMEFIFQRRLEQVEKKKISWYFPIKQQSKKIKKTLNMTEDQNQHDSMKQNNSETKQLIQTKLN